MHYLQVPDSLQEQVMEGRPLVGVRRRLADHGDEVGCTQDDQAAFRWHV